MIICNLRATSIFPCSSQLAISHRGLFLVIFFLLLLSITYQLSSCFSCKQRLRPPDLHTPKLLSHRYTFSLPSLSCVTGFPPERDSSNHPQQRHLSEAHVHAETSAPGLGSFPSFHAGRLQARCPVPTCGAGRRRRRSPLPHPRCGAATCCRAAAGPSRPPAGPGPDPGPGGPLRAPLHVGPPAGAHAFRRRNAAAGGGQALGPRV